MEGWKLGDTIQPSESLEDAAVTRSAYLPAQRAYDRKAVQEALEHLASIDLIELPNEAKVERCRATRDLRSCGRVVESTLNSCGHASLCAECSQRCDVCPICRIPISKKSNRLRLFYECIEAGLISKRYDDRFQAKQDGENQPTADVQRLYCLFDVALDNNLVSLVCHYVTDVCMDESAVSSDPLIAFLLDEVVVKDWCRQMFKNILAELHGLYNLAVQEMESRLSSLLKFSVKLVGMSNVLEVLESSFKGTLSVQHHDLHDLQECILKTKQHLEVMIWCLRHQFLANVKSRHTNFTSWRSLVCERKSAAIERSWPDLINHTSESTRKNGSTLFVEDALSNLETKQGYTREAGGELEIASLHKDGESSFFRSRIEGMKECYPFENLRAAIDLLFLHGSSDLVVAKQAIFLYYLFDRHWTMPDEKWRHIVDDFAASFGITRHSMLESLTFYLLDDHTDEAMQEACRLLPEISGPTTHPKVAQVLLERQNPDAALMVLRWSGRDGGAQLVSLGEAITAVRVRVECGLLTEAFMYQRMLCMKVKEKKLKSVSSWDASDDLRDESWSWLDWVEALVTEICFLCIRRNLVDRMIELPWSLEEEKHIRKSLLDFAIDDPSTTVGSLLVVFYLQRFRYLEAYQIDRKLQTLEQETISNKSVCEEVLSRMISASHWRAGLVDKSIELLPEVQQRQVKTGKFLELVCPEIEDVLVKSSLPMVQEPDSTPLLAPPSDSSFILQVDKNFPSSKPLGFETPSKLSGFAYNSHFELGKYGSPSVPRGSFFTNVERGLNPQSSISQNFKFDGTIVPGIHRVSPTTVTPLRDFNKSSSRVPQNNSFSDLRSNKVFPEKEQNGFSNQFQTTRPNTFRGPVDPLTSPSGNRFLFKNSAGDSCLNVSTKQALSSRPDKPWKVVPEDDPMDISWIRGRKDSSEDATKNGGLRWRSDDTSEEEEQQSLDRLIGSASYATPTSGVRRGRFLRI